jgi:acyl-CoA hydrolase
MKGKTVSASAVIDQVIEVFPNDLNSHGTLFGGRLMQIVDMLAAIVAKRHCGKVCVTLGIDSVRFLSPAKRGDILICQASVNKTWHTSMEVGVKVFAQNFRTLEQKHILSAYFTFVAMSDDDQTADRPVGIFAVVPESVDEIRRHKEAEVRRQIRLGDKSRRAGTSN